VRKSVKSKVSAATSARKIKVPAPLEWDFRGVPDSELEACVYYEFARESKTVCTLAARIAGHTFTDTLDGCDPSFNALRTINPILAMMLANLAPELDLKRIGWCTLKSKWRELAVGVIAPDQAFREAKYGEIGVVGDLLSKREYHSEDEMERPAIVDLPWIEGAQYVLFRIDWRRPGKEIREQFLAWLDPLVKQGPILGRHAGKARFHDWLRGLSAMRLLAHYAFGEAFERSEGSLYALGQSAWENGIQMAYNFFQSLLSFPELEEPISWLARNNRK